MLHVSSQGTLFCASCSPPSGLVMSKIGRNGPKGIRGSFDRKPHVSFFPHGICIRNAFDGLHTFASRSMRTVVTGLDRYILLFEYAHNSKFGKTAPAAPPEGPMWRALTFLLGLNPCIATQPLHASSTFAWFCAPYSLGRPFIRFYRSQNRQKWLQRHPREGPKGRFHIDLQAGMFNQNRRWGG